MPLLSIHLSYLSWSLILYCGLPYIKKYLSVSGRLDELLATVKAMNTPGQKNAWHNVLLCSGLQYSCLGDALKTLHKSPTQTPVEIVGALTTWTTWTLSAQTNEPWYSFSFRNWKYGSCDIKRRYVCDQRTIGYHSGSSKVASDCSLPIVYQTKALRKIFSFIKWPLVMYHKKLEEFASSVRSKLPLWEASNVDQYHPTNPSRDNP